MKYIVIRQGKNVSRSPVCHELSTCNEKGVILKGQRTVINQKIFFLQEKALDLAREGHFRTKQLLRQSVWLLLIEKYVANMITDCFPCQATPSQDKGNR